MPKPYDATTKFLVESYPADWLVLAGLDPLGRVEPIDANLSTITAEADKVLRVDGPSPWLAHVEFQSGHDGHLPRRLLRYNVLLDDRHDLPARSVVILLRPEADGPGLTGVYRRALPGGPDFLEFHYDVIRAWKQPVETILNGGLGTLPLAPVSDLAAMTPKEVIRRMSEKIDNQPPAMAGQLWTSAGILMGLRYPPDLTQQLLRGVRDMKESSFYQAILAEGRAEGVAQGVTVGRAEEAKRLLLKIGRRRFGEPESRTAEVIEALGDLESVEVARRSGARRLELGRTSDHGRRGQVTPDLDEVQPAMIATCCPAMLLALAIVADSAPAPDADLPVVVLVGDSIRQGYAPFVAERLKGRARVLWAGENGGDTRNVLAHLDEWAIGPKPAVVHFNAGLHDLKFDPATGTHQVELDEYRGNLRAILRRLGADTSARLIFATSTPVIDARQARSGQTFRLREADVEAYNRAALEVFGGSSIVDVDDLHAVSIRLGSESALSSDGVHFTTAAYRVLGERVANSIEVALREPDATREVPCRRAGQAPAIDGKLDDPAWAGAAVISRFPAFWSGAPSGDGTKARLLWDDDFLYFAATMDDAELRSSGVRRNDRLWLGDVFELFFKPDEGRPAYYEFQVNPRSVILELAFPERGFDFATLAARPPLGLEAIAAPDGTVDRPGDRDRSWSVEGRIPWSAFGPSGGRPRAGSAWRFALCRYDYGPDGTTPVLTSSAPLRRPSFHRFEDYGRLVFEP